MAYVPDAFLPSRMYASLGLKAAQDMTIADETLYIADTGNRRILIMSLSTGQTWEIGKGILRKPVGVAVDAGRVYVADSGNACAYRFSAAGELEQTYTKPQEATYGANNSFIPQKIAAAEDGSIYLIVDGSVNGLIHMDAGGSFLGFVSSTTVNKSLSEKLLRVILTQEQLDRMMSSTPDSYANVLMSGDGLLFAVNQGAGKRVQCLNYRGSDLFANIAALPTLSNVMDLAMDADGFLYVFDKQGKITEISPEGYLIAQFGGTVSTEDRVGLFVAPSGIAVDRQGQLYCLDRSKNSITVFTPSAGHERVHQALVHYRDGAYEAVAAVLEEELRVNSRSYYGHAYLGKTLLHMQQYEAAAEHFRIGGDKAAYSEAFWRIRDQWIETHAMLLVGVLLLIGAALAVWAKFRPVRRAYDAYACSVPLKTRWADLSLFALRRAVLHPCDTVYEIRSGHMGHYGTATILYALAYASLIFSDLGGGFLFAKDVYEYSIPLNLAYDTAFTALFLMGNYFVAAIRDGKATFRVLYCTVAYALLPLVLLLVPVTLLCNVLTYNERMIVAVIYHGAWVWCCINLFVMLKEAHAYRPSAMVMMLVLTFVFMFVVVIFLSLLYLLAQQLADFVKQLLLEVVLYG